MTRRTIDQYNWSKLEFDETILTKHFTVQSSKRVKFVVVHHMTIIGHGTGSALDACYATWQNREASAHYGVDGALVRQFVWDKDYAWATGDTDGNRFGISIEHANSAAAPKWTVADETWKTGARLAANLHKTYKLGRPVKDKTLRRHGSFIATACPGPYLGGTIWAAYVAEAQRVYDEITGAKPVAAPLPAPCVVPAPKPAPAAPIEVISASQNMAGNNATGIKTAKARMARYVAARKSQPVHVLNAQETTVASTVRPRLDSGLRPFGYTRAGGGKGRYCYTRGVKVIGAGLFTVPSKWWFKRDDKQAAWVAYELDGALGMDVSMHLESASGPTADRLRVDQARWIATSALAKAKALGVPEQNVLLTGDTNSEGMVLAALQAAGWRNAADGTRYVNTHTFMGWADTSRKRFDYALVRHDAAKAEVDDLSHETDISDHAGLRVRRQLTK